MAGSTSHKKGILKVMFTGLFALTVAADLEGFVSFLKVSV